jgi:hypothetical protein
MKTRAFPRILRPAAPGLIALALFAAGCGGEKKVEPVPVGPMEVYHDPGIGFTIQHPVGWVVDAQIGRARFYSAPDVAKKFLDPTGAYPIGVTIAVEVTRTPDPAAQEAQFKTEMQGTGMQLGQEEKITVGGSEGLKIPYVANYGGGNIITGHHVLVRHDSAFYDIGFAGFGQTYAAYAAIFDSALRSFAFPKPKDPTRDETLPSETMAEYDAKLFSFMYPDNFNFSNPPKGNNELVLELRGYRQDCSVRFDVFPAKGLTTEKVFEQNKGRYKAKSVASATIGGEKAMYVTYAPTPQVDSKAYFLVRNDKVFRITMNWFRPQSESYTKAYDQLLSSIRFK